MGLEVNLELFHPQMSEVRKSCRAFSLQLLDQRSPDHDLPASFFEQAGQAYRLQPHKPPNKYNMK